ncbi:shikimate dehydrogenase [Tetragenococcus muriaticus]|nr:shikimate dehydrogenase [Tetragenococcus muriaticus]
MEIQINGSTQLVGFFAYPAKHSLSPKMQSLAMQLTHTNAIYLAFEIQKEQLDAAIHSIYTFDMLGANISMPNKTEVLKYLDNYTQSCDLIGAANTIVNRDQQLLGYNTDGIGFIRSLQAAGVTYKKKTMTILGAGGAATAMICQAALEGVATIHIFSRLGPRFDKMREKVKEIQQKTNCKVTLTEIYEEKLVKAAIDESNILVNATSVGMQEDECPISDFSVLRKGLVVYDAIYQPRETFLLKQAKKRQAMGINGIGMLLYQGAASFELWTHKKMPVEKIRPLLEETGK